MMMMTMRWFTSAYHWLHASTLQILRVELCIDEMK
jgi:hypothetical protein